MEPELTGIGAPNVETALIARTATRTAEGVGIILYMLNDEKVLVVLKVEGSIFRQEDND